MFTRHRRLLIRLFTQLQLLNTKPFENAALCLSIQKSLWQRTVKAEKAIRKVRQQIKVERMRLRTTSMPRLKKSDAAAIKASISKRLRRVEELRQLVRLLRTIGNGLAFIYFWHLPMGAVASKEPSGFLSGKRGAVLEWRILRSLFKTGRIGILTDLTNCLRYGDIFVIGRNGYSIIEAKMSDLEDKRGERQFKKLEALTSFLNTRQSTELHEGGFTSVRLKRDIPQTDHIPELNKCIHQAKQAGSRFLSVEDGVEYYVASVYDEIEIEKISTECKNGKICLNLRNPKFQDLPYYPFTLSIDDPEALFEFYDYRIFILVLIDPKVMKRKLLQNDVDIEFHQDSYWPFTVRSHKSVELSPISVSNYDFWKIACEFLNLDDYLRELAHEVHSSHRDNGEGSSSQVT